jgi:hypothetical protein
LYGALAIQDCGRHDRAVLDKGQRKEFAMSVVGRYALATDDDNWGKVIKRGSG